jgi:small subunit ribosomal protein S2
LRLLYVEDNNPGEKMSKVTMREMLDAGVHFGHQTRFWNPKMAPYIYGVRHNIHIINLEKSLLLYNDALNFISSVAAKNGKILFVGTKLSSQEIVREEAIRCGMPYINSRWLGGALTNWKTVRQSIKKLRNLEVMRDIGKFATMPPKELTDTMRRFSKLERTLGGIKEMGGLPDAVLILDVGHDQIAVNEAKKLSIPVVGVVDTNHDPEGINYLIPGNDDAIRAVRFYVKHIADAIIEARATMLRHPKDEQSGVEAAQTAEAKERIPIKKITIKKKPIAKVEETSGEEEPAETGAEDIETEPKKPKIKRIKKTAATNEENKEG